MLPNHPTNEALTAAFNELKGAVPKRQPPTIGTISLSRNDVVERIKSKQSFVGRNELNIVFATQKKMVLQRSLFKRLKGDSFFNCWPAPCAPLTATRSVSTETRDKIFASRTGDITSM